MADKNWLISARNALVAQIVVWGIFAAVLALAYGGFWLLKQFILAVVAGAI